MTEIKINSNDQDQTIFSFIKKYYKNTKLSIIYKWFRTGKIKINNKKIKDHKVRLVTNDVIRVYDNEQHYVREAFIPVNFDDIKVIYEDENILIVDKPYNLEIHSTININLDDMVRSYLIHNNQYNPNNENSFIISHVHRLDKLTSGLVIYAKNKKSLSYFLDAIKNKDKITKTYIAETEYYYDGPEFLSGFIKYDTEKQMSVFDTIQMKYYKECSQIVESLEDNLLKITLLSGRKHQIRATLSFYDCPIINDFRYGGRKINDDKYICLNANTLEFNNMDEGFEYLNNQVFSSNIRF